MGKLRSNNELLAISKDEWEASDCERELAADLLSTRAELAALQDKVTFQPMSTFKPTKDKLQEYLVLCGDGDIEIAIYEYSDNPEECHWWRDCDIEPYGWMNLPEPKVSPITAEGENG